jgi:hypothetical protein
MRKEYRCKRWRKRKNRRREDSSERVSDSRRFIQRRSRRER